MRRDKYRPSKTAVICSNHFVPSDFEENTKIKRLKRDSIPSVFDFPINKSKEKERKIRKKNENTEGASFSLLHEKFT